MSVLVSVDPEVWLVDLNKPHALARATPSDQTEMRRGGPDRLLRRRLLRAILARRWSIHPDHLEFDRAQTGAVTISAPIIRYISLAQRGSMVALAASAHPVGVDLEPLQSVQSEDIAHLCPDWAPWAATERWTAFEALGKLLAVGATLPAHEIQTVSRKDQVLRLRVNGERIRICAIQHQGQQIAVATFEPRRLVMSVAPVSFSRRDSKEIGLCERL